jgi:putative Mg2+ transporter-C (MgtC) family protein
MFTIAGAYGFPDYHRGPNVDPARLAAQVASGIGFIGAGAIIRDGGSVRGLTTAATLWVSAALGVAAGAGALDMVLIATGVVFALLIGLRLLKEPLLSTVGGGVRTVEVEYERGYGTLGPLIRQLATRTATVRGLRIEDDDPLAVVPGRRRALVEVRGMDERALADLIEQIGQRPEVSSVNWYAGSTSDRD